MRLMVLLPTNIARYLEDSAIACYLSVPKCEHLVDALEYQFRHLLAIDEALAFRNADQPGRRYARQGPVPQAGKLLTPPAISTPNILLVPYEKHHVPTYHEWMKDPVMLSQSPRTSKPTFLRLFKQLRLRNPCLLKRNMRCSAPGGRTGRSLRLLCVLR